MRSLRGAVLVLILIAVTMPVRAASRPRSKADEEARVRAERQAWHAEQARAQRLAEVLALEEAERRRRREAARATAATPTARPGWGARPFTPGGPPAPGADEAADSGLDAVFSGSESLETTVDPDRAYPTAVVLGSRTQTTGQRPPATPPSSPPAGAPPRPSTTAYRPEATAMATQPTGEVTDLPGVPTASRPPVRATPASAAAAEDGEVALFHDGYSRFSRADYSGARAMFGAFMGASAGHDLADNAQYWIGECWAAEGRPEEALAAYRTVLEHFPFSDKVPDALLKTGYVLADLGRDAEAREVLRQLVEEFPGTGPARRAAERLSSIPAE